MGEHTFEIYCDSRHLHWFKRFLSDQEIKKNSKNQHSSSLFTLRSGRIAWQEGEGKGEPWNVHHLTLHCSVDIGDMREQVNSEIKARAEQKCPECLEAQKKYAKQYRHSVHQWSYGRLISSIQSQASQAGIVIEEAKQPIRGSPQEKAKGLAIAAYCSRQKS